MEPTNKPSKETLDKWHKDPDNWKLGIFYFNKEFISKFSSYCYC